MATRRVGLALARRAKRKVVPIWSDARRAMLSRAMLLIWATWRREGKR